MALPAALRRPAFRSLWTAGVVTDAGDWLLFIALPIVVYRLTGSALGTSFAFLAQLAPAIALAPLGGRLADRLDRRGAAARDHHAAGAVARAAPARVPPTPAWRCSTA